MRELLKSYIEDFLKKQKTKKNLWIAIGPALVKSVMSFGRQFFFFFSILKKKIEKKRRKTNKKKKQKQISIYLTF